MVQLATSSASTTSDKAVEAAESIGMAGLPAQTPP